MQIRRWSSVPPPLFWGAAENLRSFYGWHCVLLIWLRCCFGRLHVDRVGLVGSVDYPQRLADELPAGRVRIEMLLVDLSDQNEPE